MSQLPAISYRYLLQKAWPIILANMSVPLLGLVDTAVIGNIGVTADLGAIALGTLIFSFVYWGFGFLRMGTTGFVARANGANNESEVRSTLGRALLMALALGLMLIALQWPIAVIAFEAMSANAAVESVAGQYFSIRIWGAPATLSMFALMGLFVGLGLSRQLLLLQLVLNGLNIVLDGIFAGLLGMGVAGIAVGTVLSEWLALVYGLWLVQRTLRARCDASEPFWRWQQIADRASLRRMISANGDIMIRTLLLVFSFAWFTNQSAQFGDVPLAANYLLLQLITFSAFFLDGYAFVVESLIGRAIGAKNAQMFNLAVARSTLLALLTAIVLAAVLYLLGAAAIALLTDLLPVREAANELLYLAALYVLLAFAAFQLDGIFIGAAFTRQMRDAAAISTALFLLFCWLLLEPLGIVGLWWAFIAYVCARAGALLIYYPALRRSVAGSAEAGELADGNGG